MPETRTFADIFGSLPMAVLVATAAIMAFLTLNTLFLVWLERKVSARFQRRLGPVEVGPFGLLQTVADALKLLGKQLITPSRTSPVLFVLAPVLAFTPLLALVSLLPTNSAVVIHRNEIGLILLVAFSGVSVIATFMAGWGSNNKYALLGAMRAIAQEISYEIPLILALLSLILVSRSLDFYEVAAQQSVLPFVLIQPVAALIYFIAGLAETNRAPFDIPEAESELVAGFHTEYSGMRFALFFFAEYSHMTVVSAVATLLFLGGWHGPVLPGPVWFLIKVYALVYLMMWFRWTFPRLRFDQLIKFSWMILTPIALANLMVTAFLLKVT